MDTNLTFTWTEGTASSRMIETFKAHGIAYDDYYGQPRAKLDGENYVPVDYYQIERDTFGIVPKPMRTTQKFGMTTDELLKRDDDGYTKEIKMIYDSTEDSLPFVTGLRRAFEKAGEYRKAGYANVEILGMISYNCYAVLATGYDPSLKTH